MNARRVVEETPNTCSKGNLGSHGHCFKGTKDYQRERLVTLSRDPENRTMTTV